MKCKKAEEKIVALEAEITRNRERHSEALDRINEATRNIEEAEGKLKGALVGEDGKGAEALRAQIAELKEKSLLHDQLLVAGLDDELEELNRALAEAKQVRDNAVAEACRAWLAREVRQYDMAAKAVRERIQRLGACHYILRDIGSPDVYQKALGPAFKHIQQSRVLPIKNFDATLFMSGVRRSKETADAVRTEILGKDGKK